MALNTNDFIDANDFNTMLQEVKTECNRRNLVNKLTPPNINDKSDGAEITYNDIITILNSINGLDAFPGDLDSNTYIQTNRPEQYVSMKNFQHAIIKALNAITTTINTAKQRTDPVSNTDCRGNCAGLCTGCTGTCVGTCTGGCKGSCKGGCTSCDGCEGCGGCDGGCTSCTSCTSCTNGCSRGCASYYNVPGEDSSSGRPK